MHWSYKPLPSPPTPLMSEGVRYNDGKIPYSLVSPQALRSLAEVLQMGAQKYAPHNWEKGLLQSDCYDSLLRHMEKWRMGEDLDEESGLPHLAHAMCNTMFMLHFFITGTGTDDRQTYGA